VAIALVVAISTIVAISGAELQRDARAAIAAVVTSARHTITVGPMTMAATARPMKVVHLFDAALGRWNSWRQRQWRSVCSHACSDGKRSAQERWIQKTVHIYSFDARWREQEATSGIALSSMEIPKGFSLARAWINLD
jgi:hypothetical protein